MSCKQKGMTNRKQNHIGPRIDKLFVLSPHIDMDVAENNHPSGTLPILFRSLDSLGRGAVDHLLETKDHIADHEQGYNNH